MTTWFLGVDGGQSATKAVIGDERGRVRGQGTGGPCNHVSGPETAARFTAAIGGAVAAACAEAGLPRDHRQFEAACFGFSGGPKDKQAWVAQMFDIARLSVTHDGLIALSGATAGEPGVIAIAGTGTLAFGRNATGRTARAGGWGYIYGDEGSAFDIARQALRASLRMHEGWGPTTSLHDRLLTATGASDANEMLHWFYTPEFPRQRVATYAKLADEAATEGDAVARDILNAAAQHLAAMTAAVRRMIFVESEPARVAYVGGVFRSNRVRERFRMLVELEDGNTCGPPEYAPAAGALIEAYRLADRTITLTEVPESLK